MVTTPLGCTKCGLKMADFAFVAVDGRRLKLVAAVPAVVALVL